MRILKIDNPNTKARFVADTVADAVRIAVSEGLGDYWRNKLEAGPLKSGFIRNDIMSPVAATKRADELAMRFGRSRER